MQNRLTWEAITLHLRNPFRIAHGVSETRPAHWLRLADDEGWGEGTIPPYYGISTTDMAAVWEAAARRADPLPDDPADVPAWIEGDAVIRRGPAPARAALDLALYDRIGRRESKPLHEILQLPPPSPRPTSFTLAIDAPETMARQAADLSVYPVIKLKLGGPDDDACVAAVRRARPDAVLYVDANAGWTTREAIDHIERMAAYDIALVEQPVAKDNVAGLGYVQRHTPIPVVADESLQTAGDLERLAAAGVQGINLKLMKLGGLSPALRLVRRARELGLRVMLGCMVETSIGATAMAHLAGLADWLDLDAPWLVADDPFEGLTYDEQGRVHVPARPGIGAVRRSK